MFYKLSHLCLIPTFDVFDIDDHSVLFLLFGLSDLIGKFYDFWALDD